MSFLKKWPGLFTFGSCPSRLRALFKSLPAHAFHRETCLLAALALLFLVMSMSLYQNRKITGLPVFHWNPGYWQIYPGMGMTRIIPIAGPILESPAAGAGASEYRQNAYH